MTMIMVDNCHEQGSAEVRFATKQEGTVSHMFLVWLRLTYSSTKSPYLLCDGSNWPTLLTLLVESDPQRPQRPTRN